MIKFFKTKIYITPRFIKADKILKVDIFPKFINKS
jgi:hypothetical protein